MRKVLKDTDPTRYCVEENNENESGLSITLSPSPPSTPFTQHTSPKKWHETSLQEAWRGHASYGHAHRGIDVG